MGIIISPGNRHPQRAGITGAIIPIIVRLECDDAGEIFCRGFEDFESSDGFIGARALMTKAGWTERRHGWNRWICPTCSRTLTKEA